MPDHTGLSAASDAPAVIVAWNHSCHHNGTTSRRGLQRRIASGPALPSNKLSPSPRPLANGLVLLVPASLGELKTSAACRAAHGSGVHDGFSRLSWTMPPENWGVSLADPAPALMVPVLTLRAVAVPAESTVHETSPARMRMPRPRDTLCMGRAAIQLAVLLHRRVFHLVAPRARIQFSSSPLCKLLVHVQRRLLAPKINVFVTKVTRYSSDLIKVPIALAAQAGGRCMGGSVCCVHNEYTVADRKE